ncbi:MULTISPECIES: hypothetical protein [unclassified Aureimonas]|uniref:hypothetical protein n=1 Tax=unclassified Aureimonas TaxID=2615206 RepID=UPI0007023BCA|nr:MULTISPECIES: hypothetical protein [unclassified Aureimonas]KQT52201.1 hypothetical protein ASG62_16210 [Aureimonas sp. Leaf427]KQT70567.1 hypothetical protein ASG54_21745 [Aureimonas sp. Leaf460]
MTNAKSHLDQFLDGIGVRLVPVARRRRGAQSHARATMREILNDHGGDHLALVLRFIRDSEGNKGALWSETIGAVSDILLQRPDWAERPSDVFAALDTIDLNDARREAVLRRPWPVRQTLRAYLYRDLQRALDARIDQDLLGAAA